MLSISRSAMNTYQIGECMLGLQCYLSASGREKRRAWLKKRVLYPIPVTRTAYAMPSSCNADKRPCDKLEGFLHSIKGKEVAYVRRERFTCRSCQTPGCAEISLQYCLSCYSRHIVSELEQSSLARHDLLCHRHHDLLELSLLPFVTSVWELNASLPTISMGCRLIQSGTNV